MTAFDPDAYVPVNRSHYRHDGNVKRGYVTEKAAEREVKRLNNSPRPGKRFYYSYQCSTCEYWHIGGSDREA